MKSISLEKNGKKIRILGNQATIISQEICC